MHKKKQTSRIPLHLLFNVGFIKCGATFDTNMEALAIRSLVIFCCQGSLFFKIDFP